MILLRPVRTNAFALASASGRDCLGMPIFMAAGNNTDSAQWSDPSKMAVQYPARLSTVTAVGATNYLNGRASYSMYGSALDIVAPSGATRDGWATGTNRGVVTTDRQGSPGYSFGTHDLNYTGFSGTSAATPLVAGAAALLLSYDPGMAGTNVAKALTDHADTSLISGYDAAHYGAGLLDVNAAFSGLTPDTAAPSPSAPAVSSVPVDPNDATKGTRRRVTFTFSDGGIPERTVWEYDDIVVKRFAQGAGTNSAQLQSWTDNQFRTGGFTLTGWGLHVRPDQRVQWLGLYGYGYGYGDDGGTGYGTDADVPLAVPHAPS